MEFHSYPMTIDNYLEHNGYATIIDDGKHKLIQLKNLKLIQIELRGNNSYIIQEVTQGKVGEILKDIRIDKVVEHIQMLEGGNDFFAHIWHVDDVLSINSTLSRDWARLVLTMAMDNHDSNVGINWEVLQKYVSQVLAMEAAGII
jgi:hypothetical protein